ncbi:YesL family protein [Myceligenerans pegani]|uniref:DUF624 domain-containing protein n=1 Tax=Myceligenerans pegani TaxID=2776917 RepID=A0ABR9MV46_9MICO|nr:DUF624 domain-containing protein [Myceligenerans sp. TRM 65318]MBE1875250.1 DUF624 domain-containing protein [Myceligenerans sp. TRM 65318]MBE3017521.1 DUF624 domain-containing protein [Myceligenerans sp. TRM 65318]
MFSFEGFVRINTFLVGVYRVAYLNLLWLTTTVLGLGVGGIGPASYALAKYLDRWLRAGETPPPARTFWRYARERPWHATLVAWILLAAGGVVVTNVFLATSWYVQAANVGALAVLGVAASYVYPVMVATDLPTIPRQLAGALLIGFGSLHRTILGATAVGLACWLLWQFALPLLVMFGVGIPAFATGLVTRGIFRGLTDDRALSAPRAPASRASAPPPRTSSPPPSTPRTARPHLTEGTAP